jgi:N-methylhydantoinase A
MNQYRVGVDIGGTFTDVVFLDEIGNVAALKVPSTPGGLQQGRSRWN